MDVTLAEVRGALLSDWRPVLPDGLAARKAAPLLTTAWGELRDVASVGAWSSTIVQTGRLLELCLRASLSDAGTGNQGRHSQPLHKLLADSPPAARSDYPQAVNLLAGDTLRRLRNISAHLTEGSLMPTELAATQAVAILVAFVETLNPPHPKPRFSTLSTRDRDVRWMQENWRLLSPSLVGRWLHRASPSDARTLLTGNADDIFRHGLIGGLGALKWIADAARRTPPFNDEFARFACQEMVAIVQAAARTSALQLRKFLGPLRGTGLLPVDQILRVLLPHDEEWLESALLNSSPPGPAWNVRRWRQTNKQQWLRLKNTPNMDRLAAAAWARWDGSWSFVTNRVVLTKALPAPLGRAILRAAPTEAITLWLSKGRPPIGANIARICIVDPRADDVRRSDIASTYIARLEAARLNEVRQVPGALHSASAANSPFGHAVLRCCLAKEPSTDEWTDMVHLLWTAWAVSRSTRPTTVTRALELARRADAPLGDRLALTGMGRVDGKTSHSSDVLLPAKLVASWSSDEQEHWSAGRKRSPVMLAMVGLASLESYEIAV